jgi:hypothetical protein
MVEFEFGDVIGWGRRAPAPVATLERPAGPAAGVARAFVAAVAARDADRMRRCLARDVRMRALLDGGVCETTGPAAVAGQFREWFAGYDELVLLDTRIDGTTRRIHVGWRLRVRTAAGTRLLVEQHAGIDAPDRIERIDLLSSGLQEEGRPCLGRR